MIVFRLTNTTLVMRYFLQILTVSSILLVLRRHFPSREDFTILEVVSFSSLPLVTKLLVLQGILNGVCVLAEFMCVSNMPLGNDNSSHSRIEMRPEVHNTGHFLSFAVSFWHKSALGYLYSFCAWKPSLCHCHENTVKGMKCHL